MTFRPHSYLSMALILLCACTKSRTNELADEQASTNNTISAKGSSNQVVDHLLIATIDGSDISTRYNVMLALSNGGINCHISGSVGYGIFVKHHEAKKALELLRNAPGISQDRITFVELKGIANNSD